MIEAEIEKSVGLSHHAFCNVVIFDDSNTYSFLEADGPTKRQIVENLLDLGYEIDAEPRPLGLVPVERLVEFRLGLVPQDDW